MYGDDFYGSGTYGNSGGTPVSNNIDCLPQVHICAIRVADLDSDGTTTPGSDTLMAVDSVVELTATPNVKTGAEISEPNGCGVTCIDYAAPDSIVRYDVGITVCDSNPFVLRALGGGDVLAAAGDNGYAFPALGEVPRRPRSIEFWAKRIEDGDLALVNPYAWWVMPLVAYLRPGPVTKSATADKPSFVGRGFENPNWFDGPLNDWPVSSDRALQWFPVPSLPTLSCAPQSIAVS